MSQEIAEKGENKVSKAVDGGCAQDADKKQTSLQRLPSVCTALVSTLAPAELLDASLVNAVCLQPKRCTQCAYSSNDAHSVPTALTMHAVCLQL